MKDVHKEVRFAYQKRKKRKIIMIAAGLLLMLALAIAFTALGATDAGIVDVLKAVKNFIVSGGSIEGKADKVILLLRMPRVVLAIFAGFGLSVAGTAMQAVTRNPLVSPFTIGISNAAAFGASLSIVFGAGLLAGRQTGVVLNAFLWALGCMLLVYIISIKVGMSPSSIVLTGIALNYFFSACTSTIEFFSSEHKLAAVVQWAFGTLNGSQWQEVFVVMSVVTVCCICLYLFSPALNVIASGDDEVAKSLGLHPERVRMEVCVFSVLATAAVISFTGVIGFVGLAGPHIARMLIGSDHRYLIPFSAIIGALLMLISDTIGKLILAPVIIPVGIVISFLGVPIFINLILTQRKGQLQ